jgi:hypothetical protein
MYADWTAHRRRRRSVELGKPGSAGFRSSSHSSGTDFLPIPQPSMSATSWFDPYEPERWCFGLPDGFRTSRLLPSSPTWHKAPFNVYRTCNILRRSQAQHRCRAQQQTAYGPVPTHLGCMLERLRRPKRAVGDAERRRRLRSLPQHLRRRWEMRELRQSKQAHARRLRTPRRFCTEY